MCSLNNITSKKTSEVSITKMTATYFTDTTIYIQNSGIIFKERSKVVFSDNQAKEKGGAIGCSKNSYVMIMDNSIIVLNRNRAQIGGALYFNQQSNFTDDFSLVIFNKNNAILGGALFAENFGVTTFKGKALVQFNRNRAVKHGGAIMSQNTSVVICEGHSAITFEDNTAEGLGGVMYSYEVSNISFTQFSTVLFYNSNNTATFGDNIYAKRNSHVSITSNSTVRFNNNSARWYGGVPYSNKYGYADIALDSNGTITFSDPETLPVCVHQNCFCQAIDYVLASLTNNTQIDLSVNVTLSSIITTSGHVNISVIGFHNPSINCSDGGGIKFTNCHNCTIEGITWNGCGAENINGNIIPVIEFYHSTNITIQNCTFQHSVGQAFFLSEVSRNIKIDCCSFLRNKHYEGHDAAIYFSTSSNFQKHTQLLFTISRSYFNKNEGTHSIAYIGQYGKESQLLLINDCIFSGNKGTSLYLLNQSLHLLNNIRFDNNEAEYGAEIFIGDHSTILISKILVVTFNQNTANNSGGAIVLKHLSSAIFDANCFVMFNNNIANYYGGSIYSVNKCYVVLK